MSAGSTFASLLKSFALCLAIAGTSYAQLLDISDSDRTVRGQTQETLPPPDSTMMLNPADGLDGTFEYDVSPGVVDGEFYSPETPGLFPGIQNGIVMDPASGPIPSPLRPFGRFWLRGEYLSWWTESMSAPPLVTTSSVGGGTGIIGAPGTSVLLGGGSLLEGRQAGGRFTLGTWFNRQDLIGFEASYLILGSRTQTFSASATAGTPVIAIPFFDVAGNMESSMQIGTGSIEALVSSQFDTLDLVFREVLIGNEFIQVDGFLGYQYASLDETLSLTAINGPTQTDDDFATQNRFHGGRIGLAVEVMRPMWSTTLTMKLGLGTSNTKVGVRGTSVVGGVPVPGAGGFLARPTNMGSFDRDQFAVMPELGFRVTRILTPNWRTSFGYTLIYWSQVARPGDQIDRKIGGIFPQFEFETTDYWAQGLNMMFELSY